MQWISPSFSQCWMWRFGTALSAEVHGSDPSNSWGTCEKNWSFKWSKNRLTTYWMIHLAQTLRTWASLRYHKMAEHICATLDVRNIHCQSIGILWWCGSTLPVQENDMIYCDMALGSPMAPDLPDLALALSPPTFPRDESFRACWRGANKKCHGRLSESSGWRGSVRNIVQCMTVPLHVALHAGILNIHSRGVHMSWWRRSAPAVGSLGPCRTRNSIRQKSNTCASSMHTSSLAGRFWLPEVHRSWKIWK